MKIRNLIARIVLSLVFMAIVYVFWAVPYRAVLSYHEQFQLFLFGKSYLCEHLAWPGGMATYVAEFLVQLFNNYWIGAAVIAIALLSVQMLTWRISSRYTSAYAELRFVLAYLPAIAMWVQMGDVNFMFAYAIAFIIALLTFLAYGAIRPRVGRIVYIVVGLPIIYWIAGTAIYMLAALICFDIVNRRGKAYLKAVSCILVVAYVAMLVYVSALYLYYPQYQVMIGLNYYRLLLTLTPMMVVTPIVELITVIACALLRREPTAKGIAYRYAPAAACVTIALTAWMGIRWAYDQRIRDFTEYDYLIRTNRWQDIIDMAQRRSPNTPIGLCATNFALGMTNQLNDRPFELHQHGVAGLIPPFYRDANTSIVTAEIYYQLGLINSAQRLTFEAMEAITNYNKSARCVKRLVETNMIRGDYAVAEKYLKLLDRTLMYRKWAQRTRQLINTPGAIDRHPLYGKLRRMQIDDTFLYSEVEIDKILGQLYLTDGENILARQYLMLYPLLDRDLDKFMKYMQAVQGIVPYRPLLCQQALAFGYVQAGIDIPDGLVDATVMQQLREFAQTYTTCGKDSPALDRFKNTLWYYLAVSG